MSMYYFSINLINNYTYLKIVRKNEINYMLRTWPAVYQKKTKNMAGGLDAYDHIL